MKDIHEIANVSFSLRRQSEYFDESIKLTSTQASSDYKLRRELKSQLKSEMQIIGRIKKDNIEIHKKVIGLSKLKEELMKKLKLTEMKLRNVNSKIAANEGLKHEYRSRIEV